jgi:MFS family permease
MFFFYAFAARVSPSVMVDELMRDFALGAAILGNLSAVYFYAYAGMQIPIGLMLDRFGPGRLLGAGALLAALGCALFALAGSMGLAYTGRLLIGAGAGASWIGALAVIAQNFPRQRFAVLAGGTQAFGMLGATMGQLPLSFVVEAQGWRAAVWCLAALAALLGLLLPITLQRRPASGGGSVAPLRGLGTAVRNPQTWLCSLFGMAMVGPIVAFSGLWAVPYLMQVHGLERTGAAGIASAMFLAWAVGAPVLGALSDRLGRRKPIMIAGSLGVTALLALLPFMETVPIWAIVVWILGVGFLASCYVAGIGLARDANPEAIGGTVMGLVNTAVVASGAILQPLIGYVLDLNWTGGLHAGARVYSPDAYGWGLAVLPVACGLGALAALLSRDVLHPPGRPG